jgi:hypothetical protein
MNARRDVVRRDYDEYSNTDDEDDEDESKITQLIIFCIGGLSGHYSTARYMPRTHGILSNGGGVYSSRMRTMYSPYSHKMGWAALFNSATVEEYGCTEDQDYCPSNYAIRDKHDTERVDKGLPRSSEAYQSVLDILRYDYEYSVEAYTDNPYEFVQTMGTNRHAHTGYKEHETQEMFADVCSEKNLEQTGRRVLIIHTDIMTRTAASRGYGSENYVAQLLCLDAMIEKAINSLWDWEPKDTAVFIVSNHGGYGYDHEVLCLESVQVPLFAFGKHIKKHQTYISEPVEVLQFAPTLLKLALGPRMLYAGEDSPIPTYWKHVSLQDCYSPYYECCYNCVHLSSYGYASDSEEQPENCTERCRGKDMGLTQEEAMSEYQSDSAFPIVIHGGKYHYKSDEDGSCKVAYGYKHSAIGESLKVALIILSVTPLTVTIMYLYILTSNTKIEKKVKK